MTRRTPCEAKTTPARANQPANPFFRYARVRSPSSTVASIHDAALLSSPSESITPWQNPSHRNRCGRRSVCSENGEERKMQLHGEVDLEASQAAAVPTPHKRNSLPTRKVTIRITEKIHEQLEAATERPGVGKSMVVEAALAHFMNPQPSAENPVRQSFDDITCPI